MRAGLGESGESMSIRAAFQAVVIAIVLLGGLGASERTGATEPKNGTQAKNGEFPVASAVRVGGDEAQTRFVVDFSHKVDIRAFTLANPYRVVIDMPQVAFQFPARTGESGRGLIKAFRYGLVMQGGPAWSSIWPSPRESTGPSCSNRTTISRRGW